MKQSTPFQLSQLGQQQLQQLTTVVKETLVSGFGSTPRPFSTVDLWNIQRNRRGIPTRRCLV
jgi:hypothetical protein